MTKYINVVSYHRGNMKKILFVLILAFLSISIIFAHGGGLDANGGHWDKKAGTYHYHRQVSPPTPTTTPTPVPAPTPTPLEIQNQKADNGDTIVYVTKTGEKYHSLGCTYLKSSSIPIKLSEAVKKYSPCSRCSPPLLQIRAEDKSLNTTSMANTEKKIVDEFSGKVVGITDGDTIKVLHDGRETTIRLNGIDCPEASQAFGQKAKKFVSDQCYNQIVKVVVVDTDKYGRQVGDIILSSGLNLNQQIVIYGFAWHYKEYSNDPVLAAFEKAAREAKLGLWNDDSPIPPWEYRK